ncbi:SDR family oxidoreductase [Gammaproteobacteria bacterium]|jgi:NAD(P)-dependent dehydrogenase (short-subunit alcohol dehydrogenase family)|nr:SDR family oxidoreductase [Gammaproteobacteria bacterium]|tara:strand:+ start:2482 stop:3291 length:810 start_codon:yes stop_codon:yes gene_type:complete
MEDKLFDVSSDLVIVTGASGQLGHSYQKAFLDRGATVIGLDIVRSSHIDELEKKYTSQFSFLEGDITSKVSLSDCLKTIEANYGSPTVLINNAGLDSPPDGSSLDNGPFESFPEASWDKVMDVNLKGTFLACQVFGSKMAEEQRGSIINISSIYGLVSPDQSIYDYRKKNGEVFYKPVAYSASKSGLMNLTRYLAVYWAKKNVRVNTLTIAGVFNNQDQEFLDSYEARIPISRMADSTQYDGAVIFLASAASSYMTGSNMIIDGGWTAI